MSNDAVEEPHERDGALYYFMASLADIDPFIDDIGGGFMRHVSFYGIRACTCPMLMTEIAWRVRFAPAAFGFGPEGAKDDYVVWPHSWQMWRMHPHVTLPCVVGAELEEDMFGLMTEHNRLNCIGVMSRTADPR